MSPFFFFFATKDTELRSRGKHADVCMSHNPGSLCYMYVHVCLYIKLKVNLGNRRPYLKTKIKQVSLDHGIKHWKSRALDSVFIQISFH